MQQLLLRNTCMGGRKHASVLAGGSRFIRYEMADIMSANQESLSQCVTAEPALIVLTNENCRVTKDEPAEAIQQTFEEQCVRVISAAMMERLQVIRSQVPNQPSQLPRNKARAVDGGQYTPHLKILDDPEQLLREFCVRR